MTSQSSVTIARVIARLNVGGPATQAILMTEALRQRGYRTLLITGEVPAGEGNLEYLARERNIAPIKIASMSRNISWLKEVSALGRLISIFRHERPMVVHTHTAKAGTLGRVAAMATGVPIRVHTFHGHVFHGYFSPFVTRIFLSIERFLARHTDCIIAISESQKHELAEVYRIAPAEKISVIPLGFDLDPLLAVDGRDGTFRQSLGCDGKTVLVGWIGRLTAIKDPGLFLDCARNLARDFQNFRFVFVGDGELRDRCQKQVDATDLRHIVSFVGWQQSLECIYAGVDIVVLTSINEGTPLALLEAMAAGRAFVSTDVGGVRDLVVGSPIQQDGFEVFKNGILVSRDADALARAIAYMAGNPDLRAEMGTTGRNFVKGRFSRQRLADDLESLYLALAQSKQILNLEEYTLQPIDYPEPSKYPSAQKELL